MAYFCNFRNTGVAMKQKAQGKKFNYSLRLKLKKIKTSQCRCYLGYLWWSHWILKYNWFESVLILRWYISLSFIYFYNVFFCIKSSVLLITNKLLTENIFSVTAPFKRSYIISFHKFILDRKSFNFHSFGIQTSKVILLPIVWLL